MAVFPVICRLEQVRVRVLGREPAIVGCGIDTEQSTRVPPNRFPPDRPDTIVAALNDRDAAWHYAWTIDLAFGRAGPGIRKPGRHRFRVSDYALSLCLLRRQNAEQGGSSLYRYDAGLITLAEPKSSTGATHRLPSRWGARAESARSAQPCRPMGFPRRAEIHPTRKAAKGERSDGDGHQHVLFQRVIRRRPAPAQRPRAAPLQPPQRHWCQRKSAGSGGRTAARHWRR